MSDAVAGAGAILVLSEDVEGDWANATVASNAEPARPAAGRGHAGSTRGARE